MCSLTGFISVGDLEQNYLEKMSECLNHRGPDDNGIYVNKTFKFNIAHNRLSIIDLNKTGSQPMISDSGNVLVYNGEIYNYKKIRLELEKKYDVKFKGSSDTEVLLHLIEKKGIKNTLDVIDGMFSFCFYDNIKKN